MVTYPGEYQSTVIKVAKWQTNKKPWWHTLGNNRKWQGHQMMTKDKREQMECVPGGG